ncbi:MAG: PAS domain S-box protein [Acidobacteria bacterium]|nr:PAS domain S-box protein [Acidobacteriota bacterium]
MKHEDLPPEFSLGFEQAVVGVALIESATGRFVRVNQRYCDLVGYTREELEATTWVTITHPDDLGVDLDLKQRFADGRIEEFTLEKRYVHKQGHTVWVNLTVSPLRRPGLRKRLHLSIAEDITRRKETEKTLREREALVRSLGSNLPNAMLYQIIRTPDGGRRFSYVSEAVRRFFGCTPEEAMADPLRIYGRVLAEDASRVHQEEEAAYHAFVPFATEARIRLLSGEVRWFGFASTPRRMEDGSTCWDGIQIDITERKRTEEALRESERQFRLLAENSVDMITRHSPDGSFRYVSPASRRLFGYEPEDLVGRSAFDIIHPDDQPRIELSRVRAVESPKADLNVFRFLRKDGTCTWVEAASRSISDPASGEVTEIQVSTRDITERRRAEDALRALSSRQEAMLSAIPDILMEVDTHKVYTWANQAGLAFFGDDVVGREARFYFEGDQDTYRLVQPIFDGREDVIYLESWQRRRDGRKRLLAWWCRVLKDDRGNVAGGLSTARDITEQRALEEQLLQSQKMESIGRLAGGVAHDFNNSLQLISGYADMALSSAEPGSGLHENLQVIRQAAARSAELTRQLLAFARKQTVNPVVLDLNETLAGMLRMLRRLIGEGIELEWKPGAALWPVEVDPVQVDQVLANLAVNARDAVGGAGRVTIATANAVLDPAYCEAYPDASPGEYVLLEVADNGCGMGPDVLSRLFEPFFTTKELGQGTGLGLATVYGIVRQNNGVISVRSEPGRGTVFSIHLPRVRTAPVRKPATDVERKPARGTETVLLVEDDEEILDLAEAALRKYGYAVLAARSPREALDLLHRHDGPAHLLVTDVVMPGINGKALSRKVAALRPGIRTLFISGHPADTIARHGVLEPGVQFLQKPFTVHALVNKVREVLDLRIPRE